MSNVRVHEWEPLLRRAGMEDRYLFEDKEADGEAMAKLEAAVRVA